MRHTLSIVLIAALAALGIAALSTGWLQRAQAPIYEDTAAAVLEILENRYFDTTLGEFNWNEVFGRYQETIHRVSTEAEFAETMYQIFLEPGVSHLMYLPAELDPRFARAFAEGGIGLDVGWLQDRAIVTGVALESPADHAGVHAGWEIVRIDGVDIGQIATETRAHRWPPLNDRKLRCDLAADVLMHTYGQPGEEVEIAFGTPTEEREILLTRAPRPRKSVLVEGLPPNFLEMEAQLLDEDTGYIRFSAFDPALLEWLVGALDGMMDTSGLILDLRGNSGGFFEVRKALIDRLIGRRQLIWYHQYKDENAMIYSNSMSNRYRGEVVVLVDEGTASAAEEVAGSLQAVGRATIIGTQTQGSALVADWEVLPNGATLVFPIAVSRVYGGIILEGNGVTPDVEIALNQQQLLDGIDAQLLAAIEWLQTAIGE